MAEHRSGQDIEDGRENESGSDYYCYSLDAEDGMRQPLLLQKRTMNTTSQIAVVGANVCAIESLDYETAENDLFKEDWRSRKKVQIYQYVILKWTLALLIGLSTGIVGFFNNIAVENIAGFKLLLTSNLMLEQRYFQAFVSYAGCNLVLAAAAAALCAYVAPAAAGSGIPEVKAYLNGIDAHSILAPSTLFVKDLFQAKDIVATAINQKWNLPMSQKWNFPMQSIFSRSFYNLPYLPRIYVREAESTHCRPDERHPCVELSRRVEAGDMMPPSTAHLGAQTGSDCFIGDSCGVFHSSRYGPPLRATLEFCGSAICGTFVRFHSGLAKWLFAI